MTTKSHVPPTSRTQGAIGLDSSIAFYTHNIRAIGTSEPKWPTWDRLIASAISQKAALHSHKAEHVLLPLEGSTDTSNPFADRLSAISLYAGLMANFTPRNTDYCATVYTGNVLSKAAMDGYAIWTEAHKIKWKAVTADLTALMEHKGMLGSASYVSEYSSYAAGIKEEDWKEKGDQMIEETLLHFLNMEKKDVNDKITDFIKKLMEADPDNVFGWLSVTFRLYTKSAKAFEDGHKKGAQKGLITKLTIQDHNLTEEGIGRMKSMLESRRIQVALMMGVIEQLDGGSYKAANQLFGLRLMLANAGILKMVHNIEKAGISSANLLDSISDAANKLDILDLAAAYIIYGCAYEEKKTTKLFGTKSPDTSELDRLSGRYSRLVSDSFLSWTSTSQNKAIGSILAGFASRLTDKTPPEVPSWFSTHKYNQGVALHELFTESVTVLANDTSEVMKEAIQRSSEEGKRHNQRLIRPPPVAQPPATDSDREAFAAANL